MISYLEAQRQRTHSGFPEATAMRMVAHVLLGMDLMYAKDIVHRDLKLDNTCISVHPDTGDHTYVVIDMGQAVRIPRDSATRRLADVQHCGAFGTLRCGTASTSLLHAQFPSHNT